MSGRGRTEWNLQVGPRLNLERRQEPWELWPRYGPLTIDAHMISPSDQSGAHQENPRRVVRAQEYKLEQTQSKHLCFKPEVITTKYVTSISLWDVDCRPPRSRGREGKYSAPTGKSRRSRVSQRSSSWYGGMIHRKVSTSSFESGRDPLLKLIWWFVKPKDKQWRQEYPLRLIGTLR